MTRFSLYALTAVVALGLGVGLTGCDAAAPEAPAALSHTPLDGETLLRGVLFGDGPAAARLPEIWDTPGSHAARTPREATRTADAFLSFVAAERPDLIGRFEQAATSGDAPRVSRALDEATAALADFSTATAAAKGGPGEAGSEQRIVVDSGTFVAIAYVLPCPPTTGCGGTANLGHDELALMVANRFAATAR